MRVSSARQARPAFPVAATTRAVRTPGSSVSGQVDTLGKAGTAISTLATAPGVVAQRKRVQGMFGAAIAPVVQRTLYSRKTQHDQHELFNPTATEGFLNLYARLMADDGTVEVYGKPGGANGVLQVLKEAAVDGAAVTKDFINSIADSGSWRDLQNQELKGEFAQFVADDMNENEEIANPDEYIIDYGRADLAIAWLTKRLARLSTVENVANIASALSEAKVPIEWHADLAQIVYEATRAQFASKSTTANPYVPPFKQLITDVNTDQITNFAHVRKYGAPGNRGAEFRVEAPQPKKQLYQDKAVLHTHYDDDSEQPSFAHTKPEAHKYAIGYGYTKVKLDKVTTVADVSKTYDDL